jgi:transposase
MLSVDEWIGIRELGRHGVAVSEIARRMGRDRKTVRKVLAEATPQVQRAPVQGRVGKLDPFREYLHQRIDQGCLNGAVLLDEIRAQGYAGRISILRGFLTPLRRELVRAREATERFETGPGKQAQVDWAKFGKIWVASAAAWQDVSAFLFTLGYSRAQFLTFVLSCDMEHFLDCHLSAFAALGIPETILYDNLKTGILGRRADGTPIFPGRFLDFALLHGFTPRFCQPYRPRTKGKVERGVGYVRQNFWVRVAPAVASKDLDLSGLNGCAATWSETVANGRVHGTHGMVIRTRYAEELPLLGTLVGRPRYDTAYHQLRRVGRDGRLSYRGDLYQLPLAHALTTVEVREELTGRVTWCAADGQTLAAVIVRVGAAPPPVTSPRAPDPEAGVSPRGLLHVVYPSAPTVELRDLALYEEVARAASVG